MFIATLSFIIINETSNGNDRLNSVFEGAVERAAYLIGEKKFDKSGNRLR